MSQLMQMRQRMKTIETIQKITHAMRLIAMSSHTRLKAKQTTLKEYFKEVDTLFYNTYQLAPKWEHPVCKINNQNPELLIIIGSQKGLCGNFNTAILQTVKQLIIQKHTIECITVGKKTYDFAHAKLNINPILTFNTFSAGNYLRTAQEIIDYLFNNQERYGKVTVIGSFAKSFFNQVAFAHQLVPIQNKDIVFSTIKKDAFIWDESPTTILNQLLKQYLIAQLSVWLFETLIAEQAARFLSMDTSTRNAKNMLDSTKLLYNKLRQTKITKELLEFTSAINAQDF
ncbi:hypothetical protein EKK58_06670 [Candidatus Dependentiae bacterium]|nr:MAG: hypothetical protein EKK58_06670 [Candidatus Dependentiae bacterium]